MKEPNPSDPLDLLHTVATALAHSANAHAVARGFADPAIEVSFDDHVGPGAKTFQRSGGHSIVVSNGTADLFGFFGRVVQTRWSDALATYHAGFIDPARVQMALYDYAHRFIIDHELGHVMNGHVRLLAAGRVLSPLERQTLEMDADAAACSQALSRMVAHLDRGASVNPKLLLFLWQSAIYLLFRCFVRGHFMPSEMTSSQYAPPQVRAYLAGGIFFSALLGRQDGSSRVPWSPAVGALLESPDGNWLPASEAAFAELNGCDADVALIAQALDPAVQQVFFGDYRATWSTLHQELAAHAFQGLAPAVPPESPNAP